MKISCYVPLYNNSDTIAYCLDSLLNQSLKPAEILVVDDASSDSGPEIAARYPVKLIRHGNNLGLASVRNTALKNINADLVASVDADCVVDTGWLEILSRSLLSSPRAAGAGGRLMEAQAASVFDLWRATHMRQSWEEDESEPSFLFGSNTLFRSESLRLAGMYDETLGNNAEDVDICRRLKAAGNSLIYRPEALVYHQKKDDLRSLFNSHWNWHRFYYQNDGWFSGEFTKKIKENLGFSNRYLEEDLDAGRYQLLYLDFLMGLYYCFRDFLYIRGQRIACSPGILWTALIDLRLSAAFCEGNSGVFRFDRREACYAADFLSASLSIGGTIRSKFPNDEFVAKVYAHLLEAVYGIKDQRLSRIIGAFSSINWEWLKNGNYPLSGGGLIPALNDNLSDWLNIVVHRSIRTPTLIELAAREQALNC
ncbi:MAG: glycosyltransferase [Candidatus Omnitrophota bacterium]|jgi:glycosyltransferase involved in cell wall biosynthesis